MRSLDIAQLKVKVENKVIVNGVSLAVKPGEIHALMGPNGSGKSTLAYALAGHPNYQTSGRVTLDGKPILKLSPDQRATLGLFLAFQYPVEVPGVKVWTFLWQAYQARFSSTQRKKRSIDSALKFKKNLVKIAQQLFIQPAFISRGLNEGFSGGEKKRLEILQLLTLEPKYAVLDETDSGLDIDAIKIVAKGINQAVQRYQTGVLLITHYRRILDHLSPTKVHVMQRGEIVDSGDNSLIDKIEESGYKYLA